MIVVVVVVVVGGVSLYSTRSQLMVNFPVAIPPVKATKQSDSPMCTPKHKKNRTEKRIAMASGLSNVTLDGKSGGLDIINPTTKPKGTNIRNPKTNSSLCRLYVVVVMSVMARLRKICKPLPDVRKIFARAEPCLAYVLVPWLQVLEYWLDNAIYV
jgi:hypothetical protein